MPGFAVPAAAEKTDIIILENGDQITGEVKSLQRGRLKYKTDDIGTIYVEWDNIAGVTSEESFDVEVESGEHFFGSLRRAAEAGRLDILGEDGTVTVDPDSVIRIVPLRETFWGRIEGSLDLGFSFTEASSATQFSLNVDTTYRTRKAATVLVLSSIVTDQEGVDSTERNSLILDHRRHFKNRRLAGVFGQLQQNEDLGIELRSLVGGGYGRFVIQSNRTLLAILGGFALSEERPTGPGPSEQSGEIILGLNYSTFTYDYPNTEVTLSFTVYPSLSDSGRVRFELDSTFKREIVKDFYFSLSVFDSFDSDPPTAEADENDLGLITSIGWSF